MYCKKVQHAAQLINIQDSSCKGMQQLGLLANTTCSAKPPGHPSEHQHPPAMRSNEGDASRFIRFCCAVGRRGVTMAPVDSRHLLLLPGTRATGGGDRNAAAVLPAATPSALQAVRLLALLGRAGGSGNGPG
jgi:hypothetical protein